MDDFVTCNRHGRQIGKIACRHLLNAGRNLGFVETDDGLHAWCFRCELAFESDPDEMKNLDRWGCVCTPCYESIRKRNQAN